MFVGSDPSVAYMHVHALPAPPPPPSLSVRTFMLAWLCECACLLTNLPTWGVRETRICINAASLVPSPPME